MNNWGCGRTVFCILSMVLPTAALAHSRITGKDVGMFFLLFIMPQIMAVIELTAIISCWRKQRRDMKHLFYNTLYAAVCFAFFIFIVKERIQSNAVTPLNTFFMLWAAGQLAVCSLFFLLPAAFSSKGKKTALIALLIGSYFFSYGVSLLYPRVSDYVSLEIGATRLKLPSGIHPRVVLAKGGRWAAVVQGRELSVWNVSHAGLVMREKMDGHFLQAAFDARDSRLAVAIGDKGAVRLKIFSLTGKGWVSNSLVVTEKGANEWINTMAFSPDGDRIALTTHLHGLLLYDITSQKTRSVYVKDTLSYFNDVHFMQEGGSIAALGSIKKTSSLLLIDADSLAVKKSIALGEKEKIDAKNFIILKEKGKLLAVVGESRPVKLATWSIDDGRLIGRRDVSGGWEIASMEAMTDGRILFSYKAYDKYIALAGIDPDEKPKVLFSNSLNTAMNARPGDGNDIYVVRWNKLTKTISIKRIELAR